MRIVATLLLALAALGAGRAEGLTTDAPGRLFTESDRPTFRGAPTGEGVVWALRDWRGTERRKGVCAADGTIVLDPLPPGYYVISVGTDDVSFAVVRKDPCRNLQSPFAADAAFTGCAFRGAFDCPWYGGDTYRVVAELLGRCGLVHTRERMFWSEMNPQPGVYAFGRYLDNARLLRRNGVVTEGMVHGAPAWAGGVSGNRLPTDLLALHRFMEKAVPAFAPYYDSWEYLNEPELGGAVEPVWEYAAAYKAFALGCRAAPAETVILTGSLSDIDRDGYATSLFRNGIARYADALNIHTYEPPVSLTRWHRRVHKYLKYGKVPDWQVWLTEAGTNLEGHGGRESVREGLMAHTPEQELVMAEFAPKFQILNLFGGVARTWSFLFGCYNERSGEKDWGMMRRDGSVKPVVASLAALAGELGEARIIGERKVCEGVRAFVFRRPDGKDILAFWGESPVDLEANGPVASTPACGRTFSLAVPNGEYRLVDVMGTPSRVKCTNRTLSLSATRYPHYLSGLPAQKVDVPATPRGEIRRYCPTADEDLTVVLRPVLAADDFAISGRKSRAELLKEEGRLRLEIWNFSAEGKCGNLAVEGGTLKGVPGQIELPPWGRVSYEAAYVPPGGAESAFALLLGGCFEGRRISRAHVSVLHRQRFLSQLTSANLAGSDDPSVWRRNDNADSYAIGGDAAEGAIRFDVCWEPGKGKWFYPVCTLPSANSLKDVKAIEFEVKTAQDKVENDCDGSFLMLVWPDSRESRWLPYASPTAMWERRLVWLPAEAADAAAIRIGCNPRGRRLSFWIRNVRLLKSR